MHEYGLVEDLLEHAREVARAEGITTVRAIRIELGDLSDLSREAVETAFRALARGSEFAETSLEIVEVPGRLHCDACGLEGSPVDLGSEEPRPPPPWMCPGCGYLMRAVEGQGLRLASLLAHVPDDSHVEVTAR